MYRTTFGALLIATLPGFAANHKIAPDLSRAEHGSSVDVIVQFHNAPSQSHHQRVGKHGGILHKTLDVINAAHYSIPAAALQALADDPDVAYISPDHQLTGTADYAEAAVNASIAYGYGWDGTGIGVAVLDSGIANHPDLKNSKGALRVVYSEDFVGGGTDDHYGHGQAVAGIIGGNGASSSGSNYFLTFRGVAPNVNLINLRVLDQNGHGTDATVIAGIQQAIKLKSKYKIRVMNLSLGRPVYESYKLDPLCAAVEQAWKAGIVVVVAAGNEGRNNSQGVSGYGTIQAPGNDPYVLTVGAMKTMETTSAGDDCIASYSSKGPSAVDHIVKPDVVAPGNRMTSLMASTARLENAYPANAVPLKSYETTGSGALSNVYYIMSGTSMAAPVVSGAAALLLQKSPSLTPDQVKAILMRTARKTFPFSSVATDPATGATYTSYYDLFTVGAGYVDVWAALNFNSVPPATSTALSPTASYNATTGALTITNTGALDIWSGNASTLLAVNTVWGDNVLWAINTVWGDNTLWVNNTVWGDGTNQALRTLWSSASLWASSSITSTESVPIIIAGEK